MNQYNAWPVKAEAEPWNGFDFSAELCVPPLATVYLRYDKVLPPPKAEAPAAGADAAAPKAKPAAPRKKKAAP